MTITLTREEAQQVLEGLDDYWVTTDEGKELVETLRAKLAQETPYEIGKRLYKEGKGISFIPTAVPHDDNIAEALRGYEDAKLSAPEPEPVAWIVSNSEYDDEFVNNPSALAGKHHRGGNPTPVYTAPPQPEPKPVAWSVTWNEQHTGNIYIHYKMAKDELQRLTEKYTGDDATRKIVPLYTAPPQREWQGLTDEEIKERRISIGWSEDFMGDFARAIESKLKEKNA
jgi:hypothetical protein